MKFETGQPEKNYTSHTAGATKPVEKRPESPVSERTGITGTVTAYTSRKAKQGSQGRLDALKNIGNLLDD